MIDLNTAAQSMNYSLFWHMPYRSGNLANNSIGTIRSYSKNEVGFDMNFSNSCYYGKILQECKIIRWKLGGKRGSYENKHYNFLGKFADDFANNLPFYINVNIRRVA